MKTEKQRFREILRAKNLGFVSTVIELCEAYIKDFPKVKAVGVWKFYADALSDSSNYSKSKYWYLKTIGELELQNSDVIDVVYCGLGKLYQRKGNLRKAAFWYQKASESNPEEASYLIYLGTSFYRLGKISEAEQILRKATNCKEGYIDEAFYNLGIVLGSRKKYQEALFCFEKAIEIDPKYALAKAAMKDVTQALSIINKT
jgi:tetratricopeptide (TPR) repeat protein